MSLSLHDAKHCPYSHGDCTGSTLGGHSMSPTAGSCVQALRKEAGQWVAKYARGGSARKLSARRFYIAVDALQGHLASNGQAPFPKAKIPVLQSNVKQARDLIAQGK